jgi:hypothetical protein
MSPEQYDRQLEEQRKLQHTPAVVRAHQGIVSHRSHHLTWTRNTQVTSQSATKPKATDGIAFTPQMALQWQKLRFRQFKSSVAFKDLGDLDREAWAEFHTTVEKTHRVTEREKAILKLQTPFAKHLAALAHKLADPVQPTVFNLTNILEDIKDDDHPVAAEVWITLSRGAHVLPEELRSTMPDTRVENYPVKTEQLARQQPAEIQRHFDKNFVQTWKQIRDNFGVTADKPKNILPLNTVYKNEERCRITFDPSNTNSDTPSVNEHADTLPKPTCIYPTMQHGMVAMKRSGYGVKTDDVDAFLNHSLHPSAMSNCGWMHPDTGETCALVKLGLGFQQSAAIQQDTAVAQTRAIRRKLRQMGLHTSGRDPGYREKFEFVKPEHKDSLTTILPYCDDKAAWCTSLVSAWFTFMHILLLKWRWGVVVNFKVGKAAAPACEFSWIGYLFKLRPMQVGFTDDRLQKMQTRIAPFRIDSSTDPTIKDGREVMGTLNYATNVMLLGKAYSGDMYDTIAAADARATA